MHGSFLNKGLRSVMSILAMANALLVAASVGTSMGAVSKLDVLRLDYAYYNPVSLILRRMQWLEQDFARDGTRVEWVLSLGSNKANEYTASAAVQFGSTAGSAALLARANGVPLKTVWIYSQPEWTAVVVPTASPLRDVRDLRGKKIAATRGTDPWFFLLQALRAAGLTQRDISLIHLQHPDGESALLAGQVDAWAGLDPYMAHAELMAGSRLLLRQRDWNTYGTLNVLDSLLRDHEDVVVRVLALYERGRQWAIAHPDDLVRILSEEAKVSPEVARKVLTERTAFPDPRPGARQQQVLTRLVPLIRAESLVPPDVDLAKAIEDLVAPEPAGRTLGASGSSR